MHPVFLLGGLELHAYALFTAAGAVAACLLALPALKRAGMTTGWKYTHTRCLHG